MALVLTDVSFVDCGHTGRVSTAGETKLKVDGALVLLAAGIQGHSVGSCPVQDDTNTGTLKCRTVTAVTGGQATKLRVNGRPVMLDTLSGKTDGTAAGNPVQLLSGRADQSKLEAV
jgi:hypothetical protein